MRIKPEGASHLPILIEVLSITSGDVLELGAGFYSTPVLYWLCMNGNRKFVSYESDTKYYERLKSFGVKLIDDWVNLDEANDKFWDVIFVDNGPAQERKTIIRQLAKSANYIVVHDTYEKTNKSYRLDKIWQLFKYRFDCNKHYPRTTVLSNFKDLSILKEKGGDNGS